MAPQQLWPTSPGAVTVIRTVCPEIVTVSSPFARFGVVKFGGRGTIVKLQSGNLLVVSPVSMTDDTKRVVNELGGTVSYIVTPDFEHHLMIGPWKKEYPSAKVISMEGLREKRAKQGNEDVPIDYEFNKENKTMLQFPEELTNEFDVEYVDGHANKEIVLHHRPTRTLITADLIFNLPGHEQYSKSDEAPDSGIYTKIAMLFGSVGRGQQYFNWYATMKDQPSYEASIRRIAQWDFDRIIPAHGDVIEKGGKQIFTKQFAWNLK